MCDNVGTNSGSNLPEEGCFLVVFACSGDDRGEPDVLFFEIHVVRVVFFGNSRDMKMSPLS